MRPAGLLMLAWILVLLASALPELGLGFHYPLEPLHWLSISKVAVLGALLVVSYALGVISALRSLIIVLLTLHLATATFGAVVSSAFWQQRVSAIANPFLRQMIEVQFVRIAVALVVLVVLFGVLRDRSRFYWSRGDMVARTSRVAWLGISGTTSWGRVGIVLTAVLSLGTLTFLSLAMRPAIPALIGTIATLPIVLVFSVTNALGEEISYRIALLAPVANVVPSAHAMVMSAVYFGVAHYNGIPSGVVGITMAGLLGWIACRSVLDTKGIGWAFILHLVQDVWIFWFMAAIFSLQAS